MKLQAMAALASLAAFPASAGVYFFNPEILTDVQSAGSYALLFVDYEAPTSGALERWTFSLETSDPSATVRLDPPNQVFKVAYHSQIEDDYSMSSIPSSDYTFSELLLPKTAIYDVQAPRSWNHCAFSSSDPCGIEYNVWGNGTRLKVSSAEPWLLHFELTSFAIPEPSTWALMVVGFGVAGAMARRRRNLPADPMTI